MNVLHLMSQTFKKNITWFGNMAESKMLTRFDCEMKMTGLLHEAFQRGYTKGHDDASRNRHHREDGAYNHEYSYDTHD